MFRIAKRFDFSASHQLAGLPEGHQCSRLHGHNYSITLTLEAQDLDGKGMIRDYGELDGVKQMLDAYCEHRHLNDVFDFNPTAENMARYFYQRFKGAFPELICVSVKETEKTTAEYHVLLTS